MLVPKRKHRAKGFGSIEIKRSRIRSRLYAQLMPAPELRQRRTRHLVTVVECKL